MAEQAPTVKDAVSSLRRGITDNFLVTEEAGFCESAVNIVLDTNGRSRPHRGSRLINLQGGEYPRSVEGGESVSGLFNFLNKYLLAMVEGYLFVYDETEETEGDGRGEIADRFVPLLVDGERVRLFDLGSFFFSATLTNETVITSGEYERPVKVYLGHSGPEVSYLGVPAVAGVDLAESAAGDNPTDTASFLYAVVLFRRYESSGYMKEDVGAPVYARIDFAKTGGAVEVTIQGISSASPLWRQMRAVVYRTVADGTGLYRVGDVEFDQTAGAVFVDDRSAVTDADLVSGARLYTDSGELAADEPPLAKYVSAGGGRLVLGNVKVGNDVLNNRAYWSTPGKSGAFPRAQFTDVDYEISGVGRFRNNLMIMTFFNCYRLEGLEGLVAYEFENRSGSVSPRGLSETAQGLFYVGRDGFYVTDGLKAYKLSDHIQERFNRLENKGEIAAYYDVDNFRVYFWYDEAGSPTYYGRAFILDLLQTRIGPRDGGCFTEYREVERFTVEEEGLRGRSWVSYKGQTYRANFNGTVSRWEAGLLFREVVDIRAGVWDRAIDGDAGRVRRLPVVHTFISGGLSFGSPGYTAYVTRMNYTMRERANGSVGFFLLADEGASRERLRPHQIGGRWDGTAHGGALSEVSRPFALRVATGQRPVGGSRRVGSVFQLGHTTGIFYEFEGVPFSMEIRAKGEATVDITLPGPYPVETYTGRRWPFFGYRVRFDSVADAVYSSLVGEELKTSLDERASFDGDTGAVRLYLSDVFDEWFYTEDGEVLTSVYPEGHTLTVTGTLSLGRYAGADFEMLELSLYGGLQGASRNTG